MTTAGAVISSCGAYRYSLRRNLIDQPNRMTPNQIDTILGQRSTAHKPCLFVMLNPSTADATVDDPTIRRCLGFAKREGCTGLTVVNLFALRATDPSELMKVTDPVGPENDEYLRAHIDAHGLMGIIIAAWGTNPLAARSRGWVKTLLTERGALCLGTTKDGHPRHPLYVPGNQPLKRWIAP